MRGIRKGSYNHQSCWEGKLGLELDTEEWAGFRKARRKTLSPRVVWVEEGIQCHKPMGCDWLQLPRVMINNDVVSFCLDSALPPTLKCQLRRPPTTLAQGNGSSYEHMFLLLFLGHQRLEAQSILTLCFQ